MTREKPFPITKLQVWEAWKSVKANQGAAGVDGQSLAMFAENLENNLYKLWNRMASGSYMPSPVLRVEIPKADGGVRPLGIPTVSDRVAQTVVKMALEPELEAHFHPDSYGYRPGKSAHQALQTARQRCWQYDWVLDLDLKSFFDTLDHDLLLKAVRHHCPDAWVFALHKAMAESTGGDAGWQFAGAGQRHSARGVLRHRFMPICICIMPSTCG